ncbi:MAG: 2Fe-2S iron-sulfur cluster-binding protein [Gemmatimonadetes bacterium]|nr:2Fe-2S iron-sulfur cluster-binding protein [Gemmatimonadota bacterium]
MSPKTISLTVNGEPVSATVEPRLQLADFLREHLLLTGTHLGCEHGICGACTVEIDGQIARSCIAYTVACDGAEVRTIEGFDDDAVMARIRRAFTENHALQCGYCTPGMLIAARDIVTRLQDADERRIREELSGNLCRCTGYVGIVNAVQQVLEKRSESGGVSPVAQAVSDVADSAVPAEASTGQNAVPDPNTAPPRTRPGLPGSADTGNETGGERRESGLTTLRQTFSAAHPPSVVWDYFCNVEQVATCMPGAALTAPVQDNRIEGRIDIKLGPMRASFAGRANLTRDDARRVGSIEGAGRDRLTSTRAKGRVEYRLREEYEGAATRVDVEVGFALAGPLAQFSRGGIANDLATRLTEQFAANLQARLDEASGASLDRPDPLANSELHAGRLVFSVLWNRIKAFFGTRPDR